MRKFRLSTSFKSIFVYVLFLTIFLSSCNTVNKVAYFKDLSTRTSVDVTSVNEIKLKTDDKISIVVNSKDPMLTDLFNLPYITSQLGNSSYNGGYKTSHGISSYTIDSNGDIDFPVLGKLHIAGLKREDVSQLIKSTLIEKNLVKDPVVTVEFINLTFSVLGEVNNPGRFAFDRDKLSILEALSMAGDLTIFGERDKVFVQREVDNKRVFYQLDLNSGSDLFSSPAYYLQQNDVVYVEPNKYRTKDSTVNNKALRWSSILIAFASLLTTITIAITK